MRPTETNTMTFQNKYEFLKALHGHPFSGGEYRVLVTLLDFANEHGGNAFPGEDTLARACRMSKRTVSRHLASLCARGWIRLVSRGRGSSTNLSAYEFATEVPANFDSTAREVPANPDRVPANPDRSTGQSVQPKHVVASDNPPLSDHVTDHDHDGDKGDAKKEMMSKVDEMTSQLLAAYPKSGNTSAVRTELIRILTANGGVAYFPSLLAFVEAYAAMRTGKDPQYTKTPQNFLRDDWYRDNVTIPKTPQQEYQDADDRADTSYPMKYWGDYVELPGLDDDWHGIKYTDKGKRQWIAAAAALAKVAIDSSVHDRAYRNATNDSRKATVD